MAFAKAYITIKLCTQSKFHC